MSQQCKECGAVLPDTARACLQCGTPVDAVRATTGPQAPLQFVRPAIVGGLFLGLLSSIPILSLFAGAWVLAGGALTARILSRQRLSGISYGDGAFGGVLAGFFGAVVSTVMLIPDKFLFAADWETLRQQMEQQFAKTPDLPVPMRDLFLRAVSSEVSFTTVTVWLFSYGFSFSLLAMIGGMLMVWSLNRRRKKGIKV